MFQCRWCKSWFKDGVKGHSNLKGHRDGGLGRTMCKERDSAIKAGANLPKCYDEIMAAEAATEASANSKKGTLDSFLDVPKFTVELFNMLIILWLIRQAQPWLRIEDPYLQAAFLLCNSQAVMYSASYAARKAMKIFEEFHNQLISTLQVRFLTLIVTFLSFSFDELTLSLTCIVLYRIFLQKFVLFMMSGRPRVERRLSLVYQFLILILIGSST